MIRPIKIDQPSGCCQICAPTDVVADPRDEACARGAAPDPSTRGVSMSHPSAGARFRAALAEESPLQVIGAINA
ncbi:MAG: hypothetical protein ACTHOH_01925, partial [Lysobacteraceae bacterium]